MLLSVTGGSFSSLVLLSPCFCQHADLEAGVTDDGLRALASAGCGEKLTSLHLSCECCCVSASEWVVGGIGSRRAGCVLLSVTRALSPLWSSCLLAFCQRADLKEGVTDEGLRSLASADCGAMLMSLSLVGECCLYSPFLLIVCGSLSVGCMLL